MQNGFVCHLTSMCIRKIARRTWFNYNDDKVWSKTNCSNTPNIFWQEMHITWGITPIFTLLHKHLQFVRVIIDSIVNFLSSIDKLVEMAWWMTENYQEKKKTIKTKTDGEKRKIEFFWHEKSANRNEIYCFYVYILMIMMFLSFAHLF